MDLFELFGKISIDNSNANKALDETSNKGQQAESKLGKAFKAVGKGAVAVGKTVAVGMAAAGTAVAGLVTKSIQSYADYEQLVGGVETLFKNSAGKVQEYAANAYKTAGLSANEYMETVTSFSASLLQSLGGDTEAAAEYANTAITDMSDNANKMGTDMSLIQNAYQGFAKANYTMLDNLKLGYGGTKEEMQRLLEDAQAISGIEYDISSYADVVDAIHVIQTEMGITGTTAKEASSTISGSIASMKSSWQNLLTAISADDLPFDQYVDAFVDSVSTVTDNLMPRIQIALEGVVKLISQLAPVIMEKIPELFSTLLPAVVNGATGIMTALVSAFPGIASALVGVLPALLDAIVQVFNGVISALPTLIQSVVSALSTLLPQLISGITSMITTLCTMLPQMIQPIINNLPAIVYEIVNALMQNLPILITGISNMLTALISMLPQVLPMLLTLVTQLVNMIVSNLPTLIPQLLNAVITMITLLIGQIPALIPVLVNAVMTIIQTITAQIPVLLPLLVEALVQIVTLLTTQLPVIIPMLIEACITIVMALVDALPTIIMALIDALPAILGAVWDAIVMVFEGLPQWFSQLWQGVKDIFSNLWGVIFEVLSGIMARIWESIKNVWNNIKNTVSNVMDGIKNTISNVWNGIKTGVSNAINAVKSNVSNVFNGIKSTVTSIWNGIKSAIETPINKAKEIVKGAIDSIVGFFTGAKFEWPKIKMPKFAITPSGWKIGDLLKGSIPKLGITWHADAMRKPMIMNSPTIFGYNPATGSLLGGGEAGSEVVSGTATLLRLIQQAVRAENSGISQRLDRIIDLLVQFFPDVLAGLDQVMVLDDGTLVAKTAPAMDVALGKIAIQKGRGR